LIGNVADVSVCGGLLKELWTGRADGQFEDPFHAAAATTTRDALTAAAAAAGERV